MCPFGFVIRFDDKARATFFLVRNIQKYPTYFYEIRCEICGVFSDINLEIRTIINTDIGLEIRCEISIDISPEIRYEIRTEITMCFVCVELLLYDC